MSGHGIVSVDTCSIAIKKMLGKACNTKVDLSIEPALSSSDLSTCIEGIGKLSDGSFTAGSQAHFAAIETACRNIFYGLLASTTIGEPAFSEIWNLLDIVTTLSDIDQCEPGLVFWLVEELLDSQTIDGCRIVFDYLDSRRERMTRKHFKKKELIILRACNELLRRLSRAEDTVFCGRVFIFLFQSFPLGDRSSVNLRGEYHVENITVFENLSNKAINAQESPMEGRKEEEQVSESEDKVHVLASSTPEGADVTKPPLPAAVPDPNEVQDNETELDKLYPIFWSLQESFSMPTRLFETKYFQAFKAGLNSTIRKFQSIHQELQARGTSRLLEDSKRATKRKRSSPDDEISNSINPRYLTSRDLFDLEISDLAFRRHIFVQALIIVDFLLSLTPKAKKKLEHTTNRSVLYSFALSDEDAKWAVETRTEIATYLQQGSEGKFYFRMVDTVLTRDKNWVHWKAEACPPIERAPVSAEEFLDAKKGAEKACANKKLRATPTGSLDLRFLSDGENAGGLEKLKDPARWAIPTVESFRGPIADDDFDVEMAKDDEEKELVSNARASKLWRMLRLASNNKIKLFDKIEDGKNIEALFPLQSETNGTKEEKMEDIEEDETKKEGIDERKQEVAEKMKDIGIDERKQEVAEKTKDIDVETVSKPQLNDTMLTQFDS